MPDWILTTRGNSSRWPEYQTFSQFIGEPSIVFLLEGFTEEEAIQQV
jgi:hypothetical protein